MVKVKKKCDICGMMRNEVSQYRGKFICGKCRKNGRTVKKTRILKNELKGGIENGI